MEAGTTHVFRFFADAYDTERLKTLSVWSAFSDADLGFRPAPAIRTPLEHMVHQCVSEDTWMSRMLGIETGLPALPATETRYAFLEHYATVSARRLEQLGAKPEAWFPEAADFFGERRSRAWILQRRLTHSAHHRAQLTVYLRLLGQQLYSTYGPTADTGGLFQHQAPVIYRYESVADLLEAEAAGGRRPPLPGPGSRAPTERPD
ncbi:MAG: DinB family protein [Gemmatimonadales bacterium]